MPDGAVHLQAGPSPAATAAAGRARDALARGSRIDGSVALAREVGSGLPLPGGGETLALWEVLASLGAVDLTLARVVEPHVDALAILAQAGVAEDPHALWGVYAAEGGGGRLVATSTDDGWRLDGPKPWCSLADRVDRALVTAWTGDQRALFAIDLADPGVRRDEAAPWASRGLSEVRSTGLVLEGVGARPVGGPGWYLQRPGFAWGGIGVAAVWYGGAVGLARRLLAASRSREPDQLALAHLGAVDLALHRARAVLREAAATADAHDVDAALADRTALRARQAVADTVEEVLARVAHALGPAPLTGEEDHARRVADLGVYVRQHHAERDLARLGANLLDGTEPW